MPVVRERLDDGLPHPLVVGKAVHQEQVGGGAAVAVLGDPESDRRGDERGHLRLFALHGGTLVLPAFRGFLTCPDVIQPMANPGGGTG